MEARCRQYIDVSARSTNIGLTAALQKYLDRYFEARRKQGGEVCKGEEICSVMGPLRDKTRPAEAICSGCEMLITKPGNTPMLIAQLVITAYRIEALCESHAGPEYPNLFTPLEWEAFLTLKYARAKDQEKEFKEKDKQDQQQQQQQQQQSAVKAALRTQAQQRKSL